MFSVRAASWIGQLLLLPWLLLTPSQARADLFLEISGNMSWNRTTEPLAPISPLTFSVFSDDATNSPNQFSAFNVGIRIVPTAGAEGTLAVKSIGIPATNAIFGSYGSLNLVSVGNVQTANADNASFTDVAIPAGGKRLFEAMVDSPLKDAVGKFDIYIDPDTTNYFTTTDFDGFKFQNIPDGGGGANGIYLASFNVSITAVPEPSTGALMLLALAGCARIRIRTRNTNG